MVAAVSQEALFPPLNDIKRDIISEKEKGVLDIRKEDSVVESVENSSPCKEEEEPTTE